MMTHQVDSPVGIITGGQDIPREVVTALQSAERGYVLFGIVGEAGGWIEDHPHSWIKWGELGRLFKLLEQNGISDLLFVGSVRSRPDFGSIRLDLGTVKALPEILKVVSSGGDEGVLGGVSAFCERRGYNLVAVPDVAPSLVVGPELSVGGHLSVQTKQDIELAASLARLIGEMDAGQGVVVAEGRILAMEGPEGTDLMLERVAQIRKACRARWAFGKEGVLLKRARPGQDLRFDMPTIGPRTIENAHIAGLAGIVCAQGEVLCADREKSIALAQKLGIFLKAVDFSNMNTQ